MIHLIATGLLLGMSPMAAPGEIEHRVQLDHPAGPVDARYRPRIDIEHRQIGAVAPPGAASTLRCAWQANLHVDREARHSSGSLLQATLRRDAIASGSRRGWCASQRDAIAQEVSLRVESMRGHLVDVAQEDHGALTQALDRLHRGAGG